ncbi:MAG: electron transport complex subunit RsxC [Proteobacteria bacterium]|nr:MAG: electron transport complex subunit RsxC [Pseudomonadota bacterium]
MSLVQKLWRMRGGVHPAFHKEDSTRQAIHPSAIPPQLIIPLQQHVGHLPDLKVAVGDRVEKGQLLAAVSPVGIGAAIHASTSGVITAIEERPIPHASGLAGLCIVLDSDGHDDWGSQRFSPLIDYREQATETLLQRIADAGIVGLGGAVFPSEVKLASAGEGNVETLIINGAECEPYISCDDMLMRERAAAIVTGIDILMHLLKAKRCLIGVEDNKAQAITALNDALTTGSAIEVVAVPTLYPSGDAKQLTRILTGIEIPKGVRSTALGVLCHNVGTAHSVYEAVIEGKPLISRITTVTGNGIKAPQNFEALIGTPFSFLVEQAGGYTAKAERLIMGGPMMGIALPSDELPVVKACNCILVSSRDELRLNDHADDEKERLVMPCIRCGKCMQACPVSLLPQQMYWHTRARDFEKVAEHHLSDCIECGACSYVCPSHIPLVDYFRFAKTEIKAQKQAALKASQSRERHEFHNYRKQRDKAEREEKRRKQKEALQKKKQSAGAASGQGDDKQDAIKAALERAKAKKAALKAAAENKQDSSDAV